MDCFLSHEYMVDALHYLKEYRNCGDCAYADSYLRCAKDSRNDPLTWDDLKQMEGKPVWVEDRVFIDGEERHDNRWALVYKVSDKYARLMDLEAEIRYQKCNYVYDVPGTDHWQVYRKERK